VKYRFVLGFVLVTFVLILAACGSSTTSSSSQQGQTTPSGSQTVQITLSDTKVDSSLTTFTAGMPYHFVVTNT
jgi:ABC-type oligopeptide transport system substrate-binding subunit